MLVLGVLTILAESALVVVLLMGLTRAVVALEMVGMAGAAIDCLLGSLEDTSDFGSLTIRPSGWSVVGVAERLLDETRLVFWDCLHSFASVWCWCCGEALRLLTKEQTDTR